MGVKAKYFEIKVDMRFDCCRKVGKWDKVAEEELKKLVNQRDIYANSFSRYPVEDPEYEVYINILGEMVNKIRKMIEDFNDYEKIQYERDRVYYHYMAEQPSEALDTFRTELLRHLAGSIVVKDHRVRYQQEQFPTIPHHNEQQST